MRTLPRLLPIVRSFTGALLRSVPRSVSVLLNVMVVVIEGVAAYLKFAVFGRFRVDKPRVSKHWLEFRYDWRSIDLNSHNRQGSPPSRKRKRVQR